MIGVCSAGRGGAGVVDHEVGGFTGIHEEQAVAGLGHDVRGVVPAGDLLVELVDLGLILGDLGLQRSDLLALLDEDLEVRREHDDGEHEEPEHHDRESGDPDVAQPVLGSRFRRAVPPDKGAWLRGEPREGAAAGVDGGVAQFLLDAQQLVVLRDAVGAGGGAGLDLAGVRRDRDVRDGRVLGLARTVAR